MIPSSKVHSKKKYDHVLEDMGTVVSYRKLRTDFFFFFAAFNNVERFEDGAGKNILSCHVTMTCFF